MRHGNGKGLVPVYAQDGGELIMKFECVGTAADRHRWEYRLEWRGLDNLRVCIRHRVRIDLLWDNGQRADDSLLISPYQISADWCAHF